MNWALHYLLRIVIQLAIKMHAPDHRNIFVPSSVIKRRILDRPKPSYDVNGNLEDIEDVEEETRGRDEEESIQLRSYQVHKSLLIAIAW